MWAKRLAFLCAIAWLLNVAPAGAAPSLPGAFIADLEALQQRLERGELDAVSERALAQAMRLEGGNAADRWARALYLQLAAGAEARRERPATAADLLNAARGIQAAPGDWRAARLHDEAALRRAAGQTERAVELLGEWLAPHGDDSDEQWRLVRWLAELGRWDAAAERVGLALRDADSAGAGRRELAGIVYQRAGRTGEALALLEANLEEGDSAASWRRAAALAQRLGEPGRAAAIWEAGWRRGVLAGEEDLLRLIRLHLAGGTPARAAERLAEALEGGELPDTPAHRRLLAQAWEAARDRQRALAAWKRVAQESDAGEDRRRLEQLARAWGESRRIEASRRQ
ncbi:hypothetical protein [Halomonas sp. C05BenzN]|uniref:hypothetical protein n=1 Tax=Halomonas sp. C05BenzN TaxID=3411041 RepID=UPI003B93EB2E